MTFGDFSRSLNTNTKGVIFYAVPHKGSDVASLVSGKARYVFRPSFEVKELQEVMLPPPPPHPLPLVLYWQFRNCARDLGIARLTMHRGTVLGDGSFVHVPPNSPMMQLFIWASMFSQGPQRERWPLISGGPIACWTFHGQDLTERCTETSSFYQIAKT